MSRADTPSSADDADGQPAELAWLDQCDRLRDSDTEEIAEFAELVYEVFGE